MKNPLKPRLIPVIALLGGLLGLFLRQWLLSAGVDHKGLLLNQHPANIGIYILTAFVLAGLFLCLRSVPKKAFYRGLFPPSAIPCFPKWDKAPTPFPRSAQDWASPPQ